MIEALVGQQPDPELLNSLAGDLGAPHLLDTEVLSALRGLTLGARLDFDSAEDARRDYCDFTIARHESAPLADRIWDLRDRYTAYDASYLALAEALAVPLYTCDAKLVSGGHDAEVRVFARSR